LAATLTAPLKRFEGDLTAHDARKPAADVTHGCTSNARRASSEADELRAQIKRYEELRDGTITGRDPESRRLRAGC
jgi:hypothetical protein